MPDEAASIGPSHTAAVSRRTLIGAGGLLAAAAVGGTLLYAVRRSPVPQAAPPADVAPLMAQARVALRQATVEGQSQAIGLYQRVVSLRPDYADGWGALGVAYAATARFRSSAESEGMRVRGRAAGERALSLDPHNGLGEAALATLRPLLGNWLASERALRRAVAQHPYQQELLIALADVLAAVGREREVLPLLDRAAALGPPTPWLYFNRVISLWSLERLEEADRLAAEASGLFPTHFAIWFTRFFMMIYNGRAAAAITFAQDVAGRPSGIPESEFDSIMLTARAFVTQATADIDAAVREGLRRAPLGAGYAENTIQQAAALGRLDDAFAVANAYYLDRGFTVSETRFSREQRAFTPRRDRKTAFLFMPHLKAFRADSRFDRLAGEIGLKAYWAASGHPADYLGVS